jgi:hypothetical protein
MWGLTIGILFILVLLLTLASLWLLSVLGEYAKLFSDEHFREVASQLPALKRAALENIIVSEADAACTPEDARGMRTSAGLAVLYIIGCEENWFHHCLSVSSPASAYTARATGDVFICFVARLLGLGMDRLHLRVSPKTVHHGEFTLSAEEHEQFIDRPVTPLSPEELAAFRRDWSLSRRTVRRERIP